MSELLIYNSASAEASKQVTTIGARLFAFEGFNTGPDQYVMLFDSATAPSNGTAPARRVFVYAGRNFFFTVNEDVGYPINNGLFVCNSTTASTLTLGAADCFFNVIYI